jgi:hypothetical protein
MEIFVIVKGRITISMGERRFQQIIRNINIHYEFKPMARYIYFSEGLLYKKQVFTNSIPVDFREIQFAHNVTICAIPTYCKLHSIYS